MLKCIEEFEVSFSYKPAAFLCALRKWFNENMYSNNIPGLVKVFFSIKMKQTAFRLLITDFLRDAYPIVRYQTKQWCHSYSLGEISALTEFTSLFLRVLSVILTVLEEKAHEYFQAGTLFTVIILLLAIKY